MPSGSFQTQQHSENKRVNRPHTDDHRGMAHRGVVQPEREAELVHADAEKAQVKKRPDIAARNSRLPSGGSRSKRAQPQLLETKVKRNHDYACGTNPKGSHGQRRERAQADLRSNKIDGPNYNDES